MSQEQQGAMHEVQMQYDACSKRNLMILTQKSYFTNFIAKLSYLSTKQLGIRKLITCIL
jgi:hypothetical protein